MSVYKPKNRPFYYYDFEINGHRFHGSTKKGSEREAQAVEKIKREEAVAEIASERASGGLSLQLDQIAGRYWMERGQYQAGAQNVEHALERLIEFFGTTRRLDTITDTDVAAFIAWRRQHRVVRSDKPKDWPFIKPATVNRTTEVLQQLFRYANGMGAKFEREPIWKNHRLKQPRERVRELHGDESDRIEVALAERQDYEPFFAFVRATGWIDSLQLGGVIIAGGSPTSHFDGCDRAVILRCYGAPPR